MTSCLSSLLPNAPAGVLYVASRASIPERGAMWRERRRQGWPIQSRWIDEDAPGATVDMTALWMYIQEEIRQAVALVLYAEPDDFPLKGALVETGMALALNKHVFIVAPGVVIEPRSCRPIGSWMRHPAVTVCQTVEEAFLRALYPEMVHPERRVRRLREALSYHDPNYPERTCAREDCGRRFTGPSIYCSTTCAHAVD